MAWIARRSPAAPRSTLFDDVTGSDRRHCRYGLPQKPRHTVRASAQKETPAQVPLTQPFSERELDKSHSFFCDILLRLFWSQPSVAFPSESWGNIIQLPPCDPRHTTNPVVHSSVAKEKDPSHNVFCTYAHSKAFALCVGPRLEMYRAAQARVKAGEKFGFSPLCVAFSPTLIL